MPILTFYNPDTLEPDAGGQLGVLNLDHEFVPVMGRSGLINPLFHRHLTRLGIDSLQVTCRSGTARFRKENRPHQDGQPRYYWYAYKKTGGKLNKTYIGCASSMTEQVIEDAVTKVNTIKPKVTQSNCVTTETDAIGEDIELAGHKKSDRHLQPSLPLLPVANKESQSKIKALESANQQLQHQVNFAHELNIELAKNEHDLRAIKSVITKYREMAHDKTKKENPRFAYLIDFLAEIDKVS